MRDEVQQCCWWLLSWHLRVMQPYMQALCTVQVDWYAESSHPPTSYASSMKDKAIWSTFDNLNCNYTIWPINCCEPHFEVAMIQLFEHQDRDQVIPQKLSYWNSSHFIPLACFLPSKIHVHRSFVVIVNLAAVV